MFMAIKSFIYTMFMYIITLLMFSCSHTSSNKISKPVMPEAFDIQGHRGCRGLMPENTIQGMIYAIGFPIQTLEMDVVISRDKKVLLSHEPFFNHEISTKPDGSFISEQDEKSYNIYTMLYEDVRKFDVGMKPHPRFPQQEKIKSYKPLLSELIDSIQEAMMTRRRPMPLFNIEIKSNPGTDGIFHPGPEEFVELLMQVIIEKDIRERTTIQSFDFRTLQYLHQKYPGMATAMLIEDFDTRSLDEQLSALGFTPGTYSPHHALVNATLISQCRKKNMKIVPWTVNDKSRIDALKAMGVDGIITDYPNLLFE